MSNNILSFVSLGYISPKLMVGQKWVLDSDIGEPYEVKKITKIDSDGNIYFEYANREEKKEFISITSGNEFKFIHTLIKENK